MAHQHNTGYAMPYYKNYKNNLTTYNRFKNNSSRDEID